MQLYTDMHTSTCKSECMCIFMLMHLDADVHAYVSTPTHTWVHIHINVHRHTHRISATYQCKHTPTYTHECINMSTYTDKHAWVHIHTNVHRHTPYVYINANIHRHTYVSAYKYQCTKTYTHECIYMWMHADRFSCIPEYVALNLCGGWGGGGSDVNRQTDTST